MTKDMDQPMAEYNENTTPAMRTMNLDTGSAIQRIIISHGVNNVPATHCNGRGRYPKEQQEFANNMVRDILLSERIQ